MSFNNGKAYDGSTAVEGKARKAFDESCHDIHRLLEIHSELGSPGPGRSYKRKPLKIEVLNKSAIILITAIWEAYCEDIVLEGVEHLLAHSASASWKVFLTHFSQARARNLNTPKSKNIRILFSETLGIDDICKAWNWEGMSSIQAAEKLDEYVTLRGDVAHRGAGQQSVTKINVRDFLKLVKRLVDKTDEHVNKKVRDMTVQSPQLKFLEDVFLSNAIRDSLVIRKGRAVFKEAATEQEREEFREALKSELRNLAKCYYSDVDEDAHIKNINGLADRLSQGYANLLEPSTALPNKGRFVFGRAQKALNIYLKYLWCADPSVRPPHCPFDNDVISALKKSLPKGCEYRWTHADKEDTYRDWVSAAKVAKTEGQSLAEWELKVWATAQAPKPEKTSRRLDEPQAPEQVA